MHTSHAVAHLVVDLLYIAPALALLAWLWLTRRYPGERLLARIAGRRRAPRRRGELIAPRRPRPVVRTLRSGRMLGCWLAVRPPPLPLAS